MFRAVNWSWVGIAEARAIVVQSPRLSGFPCINAICTELSPSGDKPRCHSPINCEGWSGTVTLFIHSSAPTITKWAHLGKGRAGLGGGGEGRGSIKSALSLWEDFSLVICASSFPGGGRWGKDNLLLDQSDRGPSQIPAIIRASHACHWGDHSHHSLVNGAP